MSNDGSEILFIVREEEDGFTAEAPGGLVTCARTRGELRRHVQEVVALAAPDLKVAPKTIHLHFVRDETWPVEAVGRWSEAEMAAPTFPLHGPYAFPDPHSPVGVEDWELLQDD
jgi:hypothetical protein